MKIIHEIYGKPTVSFSGTPYVGTRREPQVYAGGYVEGLVISEEPITGQPEYDVLHIEGTLDSVRSMCHDILDQLDMVEGHMKAQVNEAAKNSVQCPHCGGWYDVRDQVRYGTHGDGHGDGCLADGTVLVGNFQVEVRSPAHRVTSTQTLKAGETFQKIPDSATPGATVFEAVEDAKPREDSWVVRAKRLP